MDFFAAMKRRTENQNRSRTSRENAASDGAGVDEIHRKILTGSAPKTKQNEMKEKAKKTGEWCLERALVDESTGKQTHNNRHPKTSSNR